MSSGMNLEQAKEYAKTMTYSQAVSNIKYGKFIKYRKATMIKLRELAEIADRLDRKTEPTGYKMEPVEQIEPSAQEYEKWLFKEPSIAEQTEPQYDIDKGTIKCDNCSENGSYKCSKCDGEMYFKRLDRRG